MASITLTTKPTPQTNIATVVSFRKYQKYVRPAADYQAGNRNIPTCPPTVEESPALRPVP